MENISLKEYSKYFFVFSFVMVTIISFLMIKSFIPIILGAIMIAYTFNPIKKYLFKVFKNKNLCSVLTLILVFLIIILPIFFSIKVIGDEVVSVYNYIVTHDVIKSIPGLSFIKPEYLIYFEQQMDRIVEKISIDIVNKAVPDFLLRLPNLLISLFIMVFITFYLFRDGDEFVKNVKEWLPINKKEKDRLFDRISKVSYAVIYGHIVTALIQGVLGTIGFFFLGVPSPVLWGLVMSVFALIPFMGTPIVWIPIGLIQIAAGNTVTGILVLLYGSLIISSVDNIIKPRIISKKAKVHPILILLGVVGGIKFFGVVGFIIGPLILAIFMAFLEFYTEGN